jgi:putative transposase
MYCNKDLPPAQRFEIIRQRQARGEPLHSPPHLVRDHPLYLISAACLGHQRFMSEAERRLEVLTMYQERAGASGLLLHAWVVLPNHYHLLVGLTDFAAVGQVVRGIHGSTARQWNLEDDAVGRKVWYHYSDRAIRSDRHYFTTLNYIHYNPVKHGWTASPYDWRESSVHDYLERFGRAWLRDAWMDYPLKDYGERWDTAGERGAG